MRPVSPWPQSAVHLGDTPTETELWSSNVAIAIFGGESMSFDTLTIVGIFYAILSGGFLVALAARNNVDASE
jgi:hypothetical protein